MLLSVLTIGRLPDDGEEDLVLWRVLVEHAEGRVGDDDSRVFLHVDAADRHHRLSVLFTLLREEKEQVTCVDKIEFVTLKQQRSGKREKSKQGNQSDSLHSHLYLKSNTLCVPNTHSILPTLYTQTHTHAHSSQANTHT